MNKTLSNLVGMWFLSAEHGRGQITAEFTQGMLQADCYTSPNTPPVFIKFFTKEQLPELTFVRDKATWEGIMEEEEEPCDCEDCSDDCDEDDECFCPTCLSERVEIRKDIARMEDEQSKEAIQGIVKATLETSAPSAETIAQCQIELDAAKAKGYK
jgi:hypothetical protein